jgi:hypothetical protein
MPPCGSLQNAMEGNKLVSQTISLYKNATRNLVPRDYPILCSYPHHNFASIESQFEMPLLIQTHPELFRRILRFVRQPEPLPNRGAAWSDIRQDDLATCMRVSIVSPSSRSSAF